MTYTPIEVTIDTETKGEIRRGYNADGTKATRVKKRLTSRTATIAALVIAVSGRSRPSACSITSFRPEELDQDHRLVDDLPEPRVHARQLRGGAVLRRRRRRPARLQYFVNSIAITVPATIFPLVLAAMAAYAFAWMPFKGADALFIASSRCRSCRSRWRSSRCCSCSRRALPIQDRRSTTPFP